MTDLFNNPVLVTGATGFIGRRLMSRLLQSGADIRVVTRDIDKAGQLWPGQTVTGVRGDFLRPDSLKRVCSGIDTVFHLASHVHADGNGGDNGMELHQGITVEGTRALLREAADAGVKRFIYVSSVKAMGEHGSVCMDESTLAAPVSPYGKAKLVAEQLVLEAGRMHGMHVCVLRLPMVYGHDNKGNLPRMVAAIQQGKFPPLPETGNKRSMVHVDDVVQVLMLAASQPVANGKTYIVTDGRAYSTRNMYALICKAIGKPLPQFTVPAFLLRLAAMVGDGAGYVRRKPASFNTDVYHKLLGSAWYSSEKIQRELGFRPQYTLESALPEMVENLATYQDVVQKCG